jgi:hypothetical protein
VLLAVIAIAVSSQAIRAGQEADAKASAEASASASAKAVSDTRQALADAASKNIQDAQRACQQQVLKKHPTASFEVKNSPARTEFKMGGYQTVGYYTDERLYKTSMSMQYVCSTTEESNGGWNATLTALGSQ